MKTVKYAKYNRTRSPQFQISTCICEEKGDWFVEKSALCAEAQNHIDSFLKNYDRITENYENLVFLKPKMVDHRVRFPYIYEKNMEQALLEDTTDIKQCMEKIQEQLESIFRLNREKVEDFKVEDGFSDVFTATEGITGQAMRFANIDCNFDNLVQMDGEIYVLDYEWVFPFLVPIDYIKFRTLKYFYISNAIYFEPHIESSKYFEFFGISVENQVIYDEMEDSFQQYVFGKDRCNNYTTRYEKRVININPAEVNRMIEMKDVHIRNIEAQNINEQQKIAGLSELIGEKDVHIRNLEETQKQQQREIYDKDVHIANITARMEYYRRMIKNPFFAFKAIIKHIARKIMPQTLRKGVHVLRAEGFRVLCYKTKMYFEKKHSKTENVYEKWMAVTEKDNLVTENLELNPLISVVVPVYNVKTEQLKECIDSVIHQTYKNWELCLADDCSTWKHVKDTLKTYENNPKIKIVYRTENGHISRATNSAIELATGEYIAFMDCDDTLSPNALYEMAKKVNENPAYDFIYSDEDKINEDGTERHFPNFKPDWSPDTFMSLMYTCHFSMYRTALVRQIGGLRVGFEGAQDYDFTLRFTELTNQIGHVSKILYHWRERKESTAINPESKPYIMEATKKAKEEALQRRGLTGTVELVDKVYQYRVNYINTEQPLVSIIIPSKDNYNILKQCLDSIKEVTEYPNYEIIVVDNGSNDENRKMIEALVEKHSGRYHYKKEEFNFSHMCNVGASLAKGEYFLFLNDDIKVAGEQWLTRLVGHASLKHTGAVGCKLLYPDTSLIQHTGVINIKPGPSHALCRYDDNVIYDFARNKIDYNYIAVTGACLMVSAEKFKQVNGFEEKLSVAYNDIDLCYKLIETGYYNVVRNDVVLYHYESISRGNDMLDEKKFKRLQTERGLLYALHPQFTGYDPFYNSNLTQADCNFAVGSVDEMAYSSCEPVKEDYLPYLDDEMEVSIDGCDTSGRIQGWVYSNNMKHNAKLYVVLKGNQGNTLRISAKRVYRPDVAATFSNKKMAFCGFECEYDRSRLIDSEYQVAVLLADKNKKSYKVTKNCIKNNG